VKVYLKGCHNFPKRVGDYILAYYADNNVVIMRKPAKRSIMPQNIAIKNNQPYLCALWQSMSTHVKALFADYAKVYKVNTMQKRAQGVSGFSMYIYFIYRVQRRYNVLINDMSVEFIQNIFAKYNSLAKLMKATLLYSLTMRIPSQNARLVSYKRQIENIEQKPAPQQADEDKQAIEAKIHEVEIDQLE